MNRVYCGTNSEGHLVTTRPVGVPRDDPDPIATDIECEPNYAGVYAVTRHYGGSEEGGWWYNTREHILSIPFLECTSEELDAIHAFLEPRFPNDGDIYSVRGGVEFELLVEWNQGEHHDVRRQHYE